MFEQYPEVVTAAEVAAMLRIGRNSAYDIIRSGAIPSIKAGRSLRMAKSAVAEYLMKKPTELGLSAVAINRRKS
jgi:excisionase family DNA binding protein